jgi:hypothetical protein
VFSTAHAHRLDEYLQSTMLAIGKTRLEAEYTLTPGVSVFPQLIAEMDANHDGVLSDAEQKSYARRFLRDVSFRLEGQLLAPRITSLEFPALSEMKEGRGEIHINLSTDLPVGSGHRKLTLENHHQSQFAAYQVNVLVPKDPEIQIDRQTRNYTQSRYELDYTERSSQTSLPLQILETIAPISAAWLALFWTLRRSPGRPIKGASAP